MSRILSFTVLLIFIHSVSFKTGKVYGQDEKVYSNPILAGFYSDPSICRVSAGYYLVNSTFSYYPGIPVFYSKDLVHWKHISDVMNRPGQKLPEDLLDIYLHYMRLCQADLLITLLSTIGLNIKEMI